MFVCELVVLDSVNFSVNIFLEVLLFFLKTCSEEYCTGLVGSVCKSISALDEHCAKEGC